MATFQILNFGCRASQADGAAIKKQLLESGLQEAEDAAASEVAILNTCTVTGRADADLVKRAVQFGANNYLAKPFTVAVLKQKLEQVFGALT